MPPKPAEPREEDTSVGEVPDFTALDDEPPEPPLTFWQSLSEITRGVLALVVVSIGILALYVAGGVFLGILTWAAPAVLAIGAAVILARYLSRHPPGTS